MTTIQIMLDQVLRSRELYSVMDLEFLESDGVVYIRRKPGCKSLVVDVSRDGTPEAVLKHLESIPAFY